MPSERIRSRTRQPRSTTPGDSSDAPSLPGPGLAARDDGHQPDFFTGPEDNVVGEQLAAARGKYRLRGEADLANGIPQRRSRCHLVALTAEGHVRSLALAAHLFILPLRDCASQPTRPH